MCMLLKISLAFFYGECQEIVYFVITKYNIFTILYYLFQVSFHQRKTKLWITPLKKECSLDSCILSVEYSSSQNELPLTFFFQVLSNSGIVCFCEIYTNENRNNVVITFKIGSLFLTLKKVNLYCKILCHVERFFFQTQSMFYMLLNIFFECVSVKICV